MSGSVREYYIRNGIGELLSMLDLAGTPAGPSCLDAMHSVLNCGGNVESAVSFLFRKERIKRRLFGGGLRVRIPTGELRQVSNWTAGLRLIDEFRSSDRSLDIASCEALCRRLYGDVYRYPEKGSPDDKARLDGRLQFLRDGLSKNLRVIREDSHGPEVAACRFAAMDAAGLTLILKTRSLFEPDITLLAFELMRRAAAKYGCALVFSSLGADDLKDMAWNFDMARAILIECMVFVGLDE